ncbi:MAG TPA: metallophosphoesterase [Planktothrix sp.]
MSRTAVSRLKRCLSGLWPNATGASKPNSEFFIQPYLQLGRTYGQETQASLELLWHVEDLTGCWSVEWRSIRHQQWQTVGALARSTIRVDGIRKHEQLSAILSGLPAGLKFDYRILFDGVEQFRARATAPKREGQRHRVAVFGDSADGGKGATRVGNLVFGLRPDLAVLAGDLVYEEGLVSEYRSHLFPAFANATPDPKVGAPAMSTTVFAAAVGNHDISTPKPRNIENGVYPDILGYFHYWRQPANGPDLSANPPTLGSNKFEKIAAVFGAGFTRRTCFSFDYGDAHWLILDGNKYLNWGDDELKSWVRADLQGSSRSWKFVVVHQPGFNNDIKYRNHQHLRLLAPTFEQCGVSFVFSGHCHYYHCSKPLRFAPQQPSPEITSLEYCEIKGDIETDDKFDGKTQTTPKGVIYLVSGAGGKLVDRPLVPSPKSWTRKQVCDARSITLLDITPRQVIVKQVSEDGKELDSFTVSKPAVQSTRGHGPTTSARSTC